MNQELFDRQQWDSFVTRNSGSFLQSWEWGEFQQLLGRAIYRVGGEGWQALVIKHELPMGRSYLYCPRGPVLESRITNQELKKAWEGFLDTIKEMVKRENSIFLRVDPEADIHDSKFLILNSLGFRKAPKETQPKKTLIIDLAKSEEELLKGMHPKTRYNIRVGQRHGVQFSIFNFQFSNNFQNSNFQNKLEEFWRLLLETAKRDRFHTHPKGYYRKQFEIQSEKFQNELFVTEYHNKVVAGAIVNFWGNRATYLHGASDYNQRSLMAPYLLHWEIIKEAKRRGFLEYDFWGIDEKKWPGITRFKKGFGGRESEYMGGYDYIYNVPLYVGYNMARKFL